MPRLTHRGREIALRSLAPLDAPALHVIASDPEVQRMLGGWPWPPDPAFTASRSRPYGGRGFVWGAFEGARLLGTVAVTGGQLGYMLARTDWGQGLGTALARAAVDQARSEDPGAPLRASIWADNPASGRILSRLGFVHWRTGYDTARARQFRPALSHDYRLLPAC